MQVEVKVPQLPESVAEATLVNWHKKAGEAVARDENLVDVETDMVVLELPAPAAGALLEIRNGDGSGCSSHATFATVAGCGRGRSGQRAAEPIGNHRFAVGAQDDGRAGLKRVCRRRHGPRRAHHQG